MVTLLFRVGLEGVTSEWCARGRLGRGEEGRQCARAYGFIGTFEGKDGPATERKDSHAWAVFVVSDASWRQLLWAWWARGGGLPSAWRSTCLSRLSPCLACLISSGRVWERARRRRRRRGLLGRSRPPKPKVGIAAFPRRPPRYRRHTLARLHLTTARSVALSSRSSSVRSQSSVIDRTRASCAAWPLASDRTGYYDCTSIDPPKHPASSAPPSPQNPPIFTNASETMASCRNTPLGVASGAGNVTGLPCPRACEGASSRLACERPCLSKAGVAGPEGYSAISC